MTEQDMTTTSADWMFREIEAQARLHSAKSDIDWLANHNEMCALFDLEELIRDILSQRRREPNVAD